MTPKSPLCSSALALGLGAACLLLSSQSSAFCRTRTCDPTESMCDKDMYGCVTTGEFLHWTTGCVSFSVNEAGSPLRKISFDTANNVISDALSKWLAADCGGGTRPVITVRNLSPSACGEHVYNSTGPNSNEWMFVDTVWMHQSDAHTLALTSVSYNPTTGEIYDADVEINSANSLITTSNTQIGADLESIVTHEAGHFLGLSHSEVPDATMSANYSPGNVGMRDLAQDDVAAICQAYPMGSPVATSSCEPRRGFTKQCSEEQSTGGCSCHVATPQGKGVPPKRQTLPLTTSGFSLIGVAFALWLRRVRPKRRN